MILQQGNNYKQLHELVNQTLYWIANPKINQEFRKTFLGDNQVKNAI